MQTMNAWKAALSAGILTVVLNANAEWLYWQVDFTAGDAQECPWKATVDGNDPYVWLVGYDDAGNRTVFEGVSVSSDSSASGAGTTTPEQYLKLTDVGGCYASTISINDLTGIGSSDSSYTFVLEMGTYAGGTANALYQSERVTYEQLSTGGYLSSGSTQTNQKLWNPATSSWSAAPEPSSTLMFLLGGCALALRRRRSSSRTAESA